MIISSIKRHMVPPRAPDVGWVYILGMGDPLAVSKIGIAVDLHRRLQRTASSWSGRDYPIVLHCAYQLPYKLNRSETHFVEARCHSLLGGLGIVGLHDWFLTPPAKAEETLRRVIAARGLPFIRFPEAQSL